MLHNTRGWLRAAVGLAILPVLTTSSIAQNPTGPSADRSYRSTRYGDAPGTSGEYEVPRRNGENLDENPRSRYSARQPGKRLSVAERLRLLKQKSNRRRSPTPHSPANSPNRDEYDRASELSDNSRTRSGDERRDSTPLFGQGVVRDRRADDPERAAMRRYALKRYAELMRGKQESIEPNSNSQLQPRDNRPAGFRSKGNVSGGTTASDQHSFRRSDRHFEGTEPSTRNANPTGAFQQRRNADDGIEPRYGQPVHNAGVDRSRFSERYSRNPEIPHSDYRLSPSGSFSPVQPQMPPQQSANPDLLERRASEFERSERRPRNGFVTQAQHETQNGDLKASVGTTADGPEADTPSDRLLLPQPEETLNRTPTNAEVWDTSFLALQRMTYVGTVIRGGRDDVGMDDILARFDFDVPRYESMSMSTSFQATFLDGPTRTDLPPRLYNISLGFQWDKSIKPGLGLQLGLTPAFYSDFENTGSDAFRIMASVIGFYTTSPQTQWLFGFAYLDREDVRALPVIGVIHAPRSDLRIDLVFPKPKISKRFSQSGQWERWGYISGEYGGGSWGIKRQNGNDDIATYSDWKLIFGFEQRYINGRKLFLEAGYIFNRDIEYRDGPGDYSPGETVMLRAGLVY